MKKYLSLALALLLTASLLAGCGGGKPETPSVEPTPDYFTDYDPNTPPVEPGEISLPISDTPVTFELWTPSYTMFEGMEISVYEEIAAETGVTLSLLVPPVSTESENFMGIVLSGEYPDFMSSVNSYYQGGADKALSDGFIVRLNEAVDRWMPNYRVAVERDETTFIDCVNDTGDIWGIHTISDAPSGANAGLGVRADWLDRLGMSVSDLETVDGLGRALEGFKQYTTDGEGPLWLGEHSVCNAYVLNGSWGYAGVSYSPFINKDGTAVYAAYEGLQGYAATMADWYARGLLNQNYITRSEMSAPEDMWAHGYIGAGDFGFADGDGLASLAASSQIAPDPDFRLVGITTPKVSATDDWSDIHLRRCSPAVDTSNSISILSTCSDLKIACEYWNYVISLADKNSVETELPEAYTANMDAWNRVGCDWVFPQNATLTYDESVDTSSALANCAMAANEWLTKVIVGEKSADSYPELIAQLENDMEVGRVTETYQAALDRYFARASFMK